MLLSTRVSSVSNVMALILSCISIYLFKYPLDVKGMIHSQRETSSEHTERYNSNSSVCPSQGIFTLLKVGVIRTTFMLSQSTKYGYNLKQAANINLIVSLATHTFWVKIDWAGKVRLRRVHNMSRWSCSPWY